MKGDKMKTKYKFIHFEKDLAGNWVCKNNKSKDILAYLEYDWQWKQWVSRMKNDCIIFSAGCHEDMAHFLKQLNSAQG